MSITVHCNLCGHENELGRMFCIGCGQRLSFDGPEGISFKSEPRPFAIGRVFRFALLILFLLAVAAGLLLVFPPVPLGGFADGSGGQASDERLKALRSSISLGGAGAEVEVTEAALNGWLSNRLSRVQGERITVRMAAGAVLVEGACSLRFPGAVGRMIPMPLPLTLRLGAHLQGGGLAADRVSVGLLPLPGRLGGPVRRWFEARLVPPWRELRIDAFLRAVDIQPGRMLLRLDRAK